MANLLDRFKTKVSGSKDRLADFTHVVSSTGDFKRVTNIEVILNSWNNILLTPRRTYTFDPNYGSNLYKYIFEPATDHTVNMIRNEIYNSLRKYDGRASIQSLNITFLRNGKGFNVEITVDYEGETGDLSATIDESAYFQFLATE